MVHVVSIEHVPKRKTSADLQAKASSRLPMSVGSTIFQSKDVSGGDTRFFFCTMQIKKE